MNTGFLDNTNYLRKGNKHQIRNSSMQEL